MDQNLSPDAVTLTKTLCSRLSAARFGDLSRPPGIRRAAACSIGSAARSPAAGTRPSRTLLDVLQEVSGRPQATVLGRKLRLGLRDAPLANGQMGHVLDFDDTHMGGVVLHASSPVLAALFALAERAGRTHAGERRRSHAGLCGRVRGRACAPAGARPAITRAAGT